MENTKKFIDGLSDVFESVDNKFALRVIKYPLKDITKAKDGVPILLMYSEEALRIHRIAIVGDSVLIYYSESDDIAGPIAAFFKLFGEFYEESSTISLGDEPKDESTKPE